MNLSTIFPARRLRHSPRLAVAGLLIATLAVGCVGRGSEPVASGAAAPAASPAPAASAPSASSGSPTAIADGPLQGDGAAGPSGGTSAASPTPGPTATATPRSAAPSATPVPPAQPFVFSLYHRGDFVAQYTFEWCVGASLQMALAIVGASEDRTKAYQQQLWEMARDRSFSPFGGANPRGWTAALNDLGIGPYVLVSLPTFDEAVRAAAEALRTTERPVGLVMWRGRHAWVMSGFESVGDPAIHPDFEVTGVRVLDPLHPHGSSVWGPSPAPNALISPRTLAKQFVLRDSTRVDLGVPPGYLLVLPVGEA